MQVGAVFFDKDGTLVENVPYNVDPGKVVFTTGAFTALGMLHGKYQLHIVSNQAGVAYGYFQEEDLVPLKMKLASMFLEAGAELEDFHYCPHHPKGTVKRYAVTCSCRKPRPTLLRQAADRYNIDLNQSWMIGDILDDVEAGRRAGCKTILINNGNETEWKSGPLRRPDYLVSNLEEAALVILHSNKEKI